MLSLLLAFAALVTVTAVLHLWLHLTNPTIASLIYLLIVLITATVSTLWVAIATSVLADFFLNYFFLPPLGTFAIADPENWVALFTFLAVSLTASDLSSVARARAAREALAHQRAGAVRSRSDAGRRLDGQCRPSLGSLSVVGG